MLRTDEILSTIHMLHAEHLDVRSVTLGLNLDDCAAPNLDHLCRKVRQKIASRASRLVEVCDRVGAKYGIPVINKRVAISPAATLLAGHGQASAVQLAKTLDAVAAECRVDFVGGFTALVHKGISPGDCGRDGVAAGGPVADQAGVRLAERGVAAGGNQHGRRASGWATSS